VTAGCESRQEHECRLLPLLKDYTAKKEIRMTVLVGHPELVPETVARISSATARACSIQAPIAGPRR
jgi:hypothetical protein